MLGGDGMHGSLLRSVSCGKVGSVLCLLALLLSVGTALGQERLIAPVQYGTISVVDLTTLQADEVITAGAYQAYALVSGNPQVGFVGAQFYLSVIDFTLGREVSRIYGVCPYSSAALTSNKEYVLVPDECGYGSYYEGLSVVKASTGKLVRRVNLSRVLGQGAINGNLESVVVVGNKAYVTAQYGDSVRSPIAVVDLRTFGVRPVNVPSGYNYFGGLWTPNAAVTPDQKYVVMVENLNS